MKLTTTFIPDLLILEPEDTRDDRGFFYESFNQRRFEALTGMPVNFVQDNRSKSARHVLRGLHYQIPQAQGKSLDIAWPVEGQPLLSPKDRTGKLLAEAEVYT